MVLLQLMASNFDPKNPATWPKSNVKPTEALTNKGTPARNLAKSKVKDRFKTDAKTPVYEDISGLSMRGSGTPLGTSTGINPMNKKQIAAGLGVAVGGAVAGRAIAKIGSAAIPAVEKAVSKVDVPNNPLSKAESKAFENIAKSETKIAKTETKALNKVVEKEIKTSNKE